MDPPKKNNDINPTDVFWNAYTLEIIKVGNQST